MPPKKKIVKSTPTKIESTTPSKTNFDELKNQVDEKLKKFVTESRNIFDRPFNEITYEELERIINENLFTFSSNFVNVIDFEDNKVILEPKTRLMHSKYGLCSLVQEVANNIILTRKHLELDPKITIGEDWYDGPIVDKKYVDKHIIPEWQIIDKKETVAMIMKTDPKTVEKESMEITDNKDENKKTDGHLHYCRVFNDFKDGIRNDCSWCKNI
jgi:hypothetical protein